jgi:hypothetical protein
MRELHMNTKVPTNFSEEKTYLCDYSYAGSRWAVEIVATSFEDAEARLRALSRGTVAGEIKAIIPISPTWIDKLWQWAKQKF